MLLVARLTACSILTPCHSLVVFCCSRRRDGSDPSDEDELYIADLHGTTQNVAEDRGSKSQPTAVLEGISLRWKEGESIAEAHAELDGAPHHIYSSERDLAGPVNTRSGPTIRVLMAAVHFFTLNAVGSAGIYRVLSDRNNHVLTGNEVRCLPVPFGTSARYPGTLSKPSITCLFVARLIDC